MRQWVQSNWTLPSDLTTYICYVNIFHNLLQIWVQYMKKYKAYLNIDKSSMFSTKTTNRIQSTFHFCTNVNPQGCTHRQASGNINTVMHITSQNTATWLKRLCPISNLMTHHNEIVHKNNCNYLKNCHSRIKKSVYIYLILSIFFFFHGSYSRWKLECPPRSIMKLHFRIMYWTMIMSIKLWNFKSHPCYNC